MRKTIIIFLLCSLTSILISQSKQDYNWIFGKDQRSQQDGIQGLRFDFNQSPVEPIAATNGLYFDQNNASISDADGNLLFYTNGCAVADATHQIMSNGDSINAGIFFDTFWRGDCKFGYPGGQDVTILPDPGNEMGFYIIHKTIRVTDQSEVILDFLKYTYVDMSLNNGLGDVTDKNIVIDDKSYLFSYLTSIQHSNGDDWWIVHPKEIDNIFYSYLLSEEGFELVDSTVIGDNPFGINSSASGDSKFSPDGSKYVYFNLFDGVWVTDFDRETGVLSNFKFLNLTIPQFATFSSVEFSPNSRFLYLSATDTLWQVDLWEDNLEDGKVLIDTYIDDEEDIFGTRFFTSTLGPDCRIYIRGGSGSLFMHVIHKPDEKGLDCDFELRGLRMPYFYSTGSFPNFPRFRVDEDEVCDPSITTFLAEDIFYRHQLEVFPNPFVDHTNIKLPDNHKGHIQVIDMNGQRVWQGYNSELSRSLDLHTLSTGTYSIEFLPDDNVERIVYTQRVVKVE